MYVEAHKADLAKFSAILVHDTGTGRVLTVGLQGNFNAKPVVDPILAKMRVLGVAESSARSSRGTDHASFADGGVPGFFCIQDPAEYNRKTHHTQADTLDAVWADQLTQGAQVLAVWAYNVASLDALLPRMPPPPPRPRATE